MRTTVILESDELLSVPEAARVADVTAVTMRLWLLSGRIPAKPAGRHLYARRVDVETYAATRRAQRTEGAAMTP